MPKTRRSAITEKCNKLANPRSRKNAQMLRSAVTKNWVKIAGPWSRKNATKSQVKEKCQKYLSQQLWRNAENSNVRSNGKCLGQQLRKNAKNSQVRDHGKMPKMLKSTVTKKCQKLAGPQSRKNATSSQIRGHGKMLKCFGQQLRKNA